MLNLIGNLGYRKQNPDGTWKRTKISRGYKDYGKGLFDHILKEQLKVSSPPGELELQFF